MRRKPSRGELASIPQLVEEYGVSERTVWYLVKAGDLPRYRLPGAGRRTFVERAAFAQVWDEGRSEPLALVASEAA